MSTKNTSEGFETKAIQSGQDYNKNANLEIVTPIVTSTTFFQHDPTHMKVKIKFYFFFYRIHYYGCDFIYIRTFFILASVIRLETRCNNVWHHWIMPSIV